MPVGPFVKFAGNPVLTPGSTDWEQRAVYNPAVWTDGASVWMLYRAEDSTGTGKWNGTSRIGLAVSKDGRHFERMPEPVFVPTEAWELPGGSEDPRIVQVDSVFYLTYTAYDGETARLALATGRDLHSWEKHGLVFPDRGWTKSGAIFDRPVKGRYWMYFGDTNIWAAYSTDLLNWTVVEEPVLQPRSGEFDSRLVEPGPPPLLTDKGILLLYNGADDDLVYKTGFAIFNPDNPLELIERSSAPILEPTDQLEKEGQVDNVVFVEGLVYFQNEWLLYYGMGDSRIGLAVQQDSGSDK